MLINSLFNNNNNNNYKWLQVPPFNLTVNVGNDNNTVCLKKVRPKSEEH